MDSLENYANQSLLIGFLVDGNEDENCRYYTRFSDITTYIYHIYKTQHKNAGETRQAINKSHSEQDTIKFKFLQHNSCIRTKHKTNLTHPLCTSCGSNARIYRWKFGWRGLASEQRSRYTCIVHAQRCWPACIVKPLACETVRYMELLKHFVIHIRRLIYVIFCSL